MRGWAIIAALAIGAGPASAADRSVRHVPVEPPKLSSEGGGLFDFGKSKRACVPVNRIAGAEVKNDRTIEISLRNGERWRMRFAEDCPALGYYEGFYYRRTHAGYLCAGRDAVIARSGGECPIHSLSRTRKARKKPD